VPSYHLQCVLGDFHTFTDTLKYFSDFYLRSISMKLAYHITPYGVVKDATAKQWLPFWLRLKQFEYISFNGI